MEILKDTDGGTLIKKDGKLYKLILKQQTSESLADLEEVKIAFTPRAEAMLEEMANEVLFKED